jgi:GntR family transcriptional repressor for pyruvate dehydrogenase complex
MTKLSRETLADRLLADLERQILSGRILPGQALPNERELCEAFAVGRTTVREASQGLLAVGLVERVGKALIVSDFMGLCQEDLGLASLASRVSIDEVYETRKLIEVHSVRLAARYRSDEDLLRLIAILETMDTTDTEKYHSSDIDFHTAVVFASGNSVLSQVYESSKHLFFKLPAFWRLFAHQENAKTATIGSGIEGHRRIYHAIESRDLDLAENLMFEHLDDVQQGLLWSIEYLQSDKTNLEAI